MSRIRIVRFAVFICLFVAAVVVASRSMPVVEAGAAVVVAAEDASGRALGAARALLAGQDPGQAEALIRRGLERGEAGDQAGALAALDSASVEAPWFGDWIHLFAAEVAAAAGDTAEVRRRLAASDPELVRERGWRLPLDAAREAGDSQAARQAALEAAQRASSAGRRALAWAMLGDLRLEAGDTAGAREAFRSAMETPGSSGAVDAARSLSRLGPRAAEWRTIAAIYRRHGNQTRAIEGYERWLAEGLGTPAERAAVRLELGQASFDAGRFREAEGILSELAADSVPARIAAEAMYVAARSQYRQGRSPEGQQTLVRLSERFPQEEATARGLYLLADLRHDDRAMDDARRFYRQAVSAAPALNEAGLALMRLGGLAYLDNDHAQAARIYEEYLAAHPQGRRAEQARYWAARSYQELDRPADAERLLRQLRTADPFSYYGVRAAELLGADVLDVPMQAAPPRTMAADSVVAAGIRSVDLLGELERREDLVVEVERLRRGAAAQAGADYALAEALNERGHTLTGINMGWQIRRDGAAWNPRLLRIIYPFPFRETILRESRTRGLDPYLVAGLIRRESAFSPVVVSPAGAIGLMQIMPETGRGLAQGAGVRGFTPEILKEPELNIQLGVRFLDELMRRFGSEHLPTVLSAYNAGPTRAVRWREMPEHADPELFTERIPYAETRDYVRHVLFYRALYRALYPDAAPGDGGR